jgi:hypothetical protein
MARPVQPNLSWADAQAVTPNDNTDLPNGTSGGLMVTSVAGGTTLTFITSAGTTVALSGVTLNLVIPIACNRVKSTGTLATVAALY